VLAAAKGTVYRSLLRGLRGLGFDVTLSSRGHTSLFFELETMVSFPLTCARKHALSHTPRYEQSSSRITIFLLFLLIKGSCTSCTCWNLLDRHCQLKLPSMLRDVHVQLQSTAVFIGPFNREAASYVYS